MAQPYAFSSLQVMPTNAFYINSMHYTLKFVSYLPGTL